MEEQKLIEIYPVVGKSLDYYFNPRAIAVWSVCLSVLCLIVGGIVYAVHRYLTSAQMRAKKALNRLKKEPCYTSDQAKETVSRVSAIIRRFLIQKYTLTAMGMTDAELISFLQTKMTDQSIIKDSEQLLLGTHQIRFSHGQAHKPLCEQLIQDAVRFVKNIS